VGDLGVVQPLMAHPVVTWKVVQVVAIVEEVVLTAHPPNILVMGVDLTMGARISQTMQTIGRGMVM